MTSIVNNPKSQNDVVSCVSHMLYEFEQAVTQELGDLAAVVYDQDLSYESGLSSFIERNNYLGSTYRPRELFVYNRTVTEDSLFGIASRAKNTMGTKRIPEGVLKYSCAYSEYDLNFLYFTHDIELAEKFEVVYNSNSGISAIRELTVHMDDLGDFKYFITPLPLTEVSFVTNDGAAYKGIMGVMRVRGFFFVFEGSSGIIEEINTKIQAKRNSDAVVSGGMISLQKLTVK